MLETIGVALFGVLLGMRHALEPDHLAAMSTLAVEQRSPTAGLRLGATWGLGHTLSLLVVGGALAAAGRAMPARASDALETCVAVMIVALGLRALYHAAREGADGPQRWHLHGQARHFHAAGAAHVHLGPWTLAMRPLLVGLVHGLAGSGALTALVMARIPTLVGRLTYIGLFGLGSIIGMALLTGVAGTPLVRVGKRRVARILLMTASGVLAIVVGGVWGLQSLRSLTS